MILFASDWAKYPNARPDYDTRNRSWVRLAALYKAMGVQNHTFLLALHDQSLRGVDPFDYENLSREMIVRIAVECRVNPWYFFREVVRIPAGSGDDAVMLEANRGNIGLFWYFFNHVTVFLIQIRQTGKSINSDILDCYLLDIRCTNTTVNLLTKDDSLRSVNIQRIKDIFTGLPWYLNQRGKKDLDNTEVINVSTLGNWYRTALPQKSPKLALNVGRGFTAAIFKNDEGPFCSNSRISIPAALAAGTNARDRARKNNEPYGTVFTTTSGKKDDPDGKFFYQEICSAAVHTEHHYDCLDAESLERMIRSSSRTNIRTVKKDNTLGGEFAVNLTLNHRQLGKDDKWLARAIQDSKASGDDANRDFFNIWTSGGIRSPFSPAEADRMRASEREPLWVEQFHKQGYKINWHVPRDKIDELFAKHKVILTTDTSDASGGDDIGISGYLDKTGQLLFCCNINVTNLLVFFDWYAQELIIKRPSMTAIIERKSTGVALIDYLLQVLPEYGIDPCKRLFNRIVNEKEVYKDEWEEMQLPMSRRDRDFLVLNKRHFGFATSSGGLTSRSELYSTTLSSAVRIVGDAIYDKVVIDQILGLVQKNGRVDHAAGEHDDMVIGWLLGHWFMTQGRNLYFYGINQLDIFSLVRQKDDHTPEKRYETNQQTMIKAMIQKALEELASEMDPFIIERKESYIRNLQSSVREDDGDIYSIEELITKAKDARKRRISNNAHNNGNYDNNYGKMRDIGFNDVAQYRSSFLK